MADQYMAESSSIYLQMLIILPSIGTLLKVIGILDTNFGSITRRREMHPQRYHLYMSEKSNSRYGSSYYKAVLVAST
jgi:hypothetical protein